MPRDPEKVREYNRQYREKHAARLKAVGSVYRAANREKLREWHRENRRQNREALNMKKRLEPYDLTQEQLDALMEAQAGLCAICARPPEGRGPNAVLHIDHCHATGEVRGLLCAACNRGLGFFRDDPQRLTAAARYVQAEN